MFPNSHIIFALLPERSTMVIEAFEIRVSVFRVIISPGIIVSSNDMGEIPLLYNTGYSKSLRKLTI